MRLCQDCPVGVGVMSEPYIIRIFVPDGDGAGASRRGKSSLRIRVLP
jgi:hypothetical protein